MNVFVILLNWIFAWQVIHGDHITFTLLDPQSKVIYTKERSDGFDLEQRVHIPGDYGFCFNNQNSREETGVSFEWDFHLGIYVFYILELVSIVAKTSKTRLKN